MLDVMGEDYFIDLDEIEKYVDMTDESADMSGFTEMKINIIKFEMVKLMIEVVLADELPYDDNLGIKSSKPKMTIPFKLAFNSLLNKKIIKHF